MNTLAITRRIILCGGLLVSALLFIYPHWRAQFSFANTQFDYDVGRSFISSPPTVKPNDLADLLGWKEVLNKQSGDGIIHPAYELVREIVVTYRIHRTRQNTEVALSLLFTFGLLWALRNSTSGEAPAQVAA